MRYVIIAILSFIPLTTMAMSQQQKAPTSDAVQAQQAEQMAQEANRKVGAPGITNFTEKKLVRWLYELRDEPNFRTYSYIVTMTGQLIKICDSVGYGINASIQFSNPEKIVVNQYYNGGGIYGTLPQAEPNGLFMPEGLAATYVMCVDQENEDVKAVYVEPEVIVSPIELSW